MPPVFVTGVKHICAFFGISHNTLHDWRKRGLPVAKIGDTVVIVVEDAVAWVREHRNGTPCQAPKTYRQ